MGCGKKKLMLVWRYYKLLSGCLANGHFPRVSRQSRLSANNKDDNEMKPAAEHRLSGIYFKAEQNSQLGDRLMKAVQPSIVSNGVPYLQMMSHSTSRREKEEKKEMIQNRFH